MRSYPFTDSGNHLSDLSFLKGFDRLQDTFPDRASTSALSLNSPVNINTIRNWKKAAFRKNKPDFLPEWKTVFQLYEYFALETQRSLEYLLNGPDYSKMQIDLQEELRLSSEAIESLNRLNRSQKELLECLIQLPEFENEILSQLGKYYETVLPYSVRETGTDVLKDKLRYIAISMEFRNNLRESIEESIDKLLINFRSPSGKSFETSRHEKNEISFVSGLKRMMQLRDLSTKELVSGMNCLAFLEDFKKLPDAKQTEALQNAEKLNDQDLLNLLEWAQHTPNILTRLLTEELINNSFRENLQNLMDSIKITSKDLTEGITESTVRSWLQQPKNKDGKNAPTIIPGLKTIKKLCVLLGCDVDCLFNISNFICEKNRYLALYMNFSSEQTIFWFQSLSIMDNNNIEYILECFGGDFKQLFTTLDIIRKLSDLRLAILEKTKNYFSEQDESLYWKVFNLLSLKYGISDWTEPSDIMCILYDDAFFEANKVLKIEENGVTIEFENPDFWKSILRSNTQDTLIDFLNPRFLEIIIHDFTLSAKDQFRELVFNTLDQIDKYLARRDPSDTHDL